YRKSGDEISDRGYEGKASEHAPLEPRIADPDILVAVNLDPKNAQATMVHVPIDAMGIGASEPFVVHDLLTGARFTWTGSRNYVRLDPQDQVAHVLRVER